MTMLPCPSDLAFVAKHQMEERIRAAQHHQKLCIARSGDRDGATATPLRSGVRSRFARFTYLRMPFRRPDPPRTPALNARASES